MKNKKFRLFSKGIKLGNILKCTYYIKPCVYGTDKFPLEVIANDHKYIIELSCSNKERDKITDIFGSLKPTKFTISNIAKKNNKPNRVKSRCLALLSSVETRYPEDIIKIILEL